MRTISAPCASSAIPTRLRELLDGEPRRLLLQPLPLERAGDHQVGIVGVEGFLQVVIGPQLHRLDRAVDHTINGAFASTGQKCTATSRVIVDPAALTVTARSDQGPVKHLVSEWKIVPTGDNRCDINFTVDYTLKSKMLQMVLSGMFDMAVRKVMSAFEERARVLYGPAIS